MSRRPSMADRKRRVREAWERIEDTEPEIRTDLLIARVADVTGEDYCDVAELICWESEQ